MPAVAAVAAPCGLSGGVSGAPPLGRVAAAMAWAAEASSPAGTRSGAGGSGSLGAGRGCSAGGPTGIVASASRRSSRSAGVSPAHSGETGEPEQDWQWWRSSRSEQRSESDIAAIETGVRGCRRACLTTSQCIGGVLWAVLCDAGGGGGSWRWPRVVMGWWTSISTGAGGGRATRFTRCATAPSLGWGWGLWIVVGRQELPGGGAQSGPP